VIHDILGVLDMRLQSVRSAVEHQQALAAATPTLWPVLGWISSGFGSRSDPFTEGHEFHPGLDLSADYGTPVHATADGIVESAGWDGDYGNAIMLKHGYGIATRYGHLSRMAVRAGQTVHRGDVIGYVGATGRATGPHLHYEVLLNGQTVNPLGFLTKPLG
jgi:murein DD-endopeptidase MepM/ murein hydrolase activator NlpD